MNYKNCQFLIIIISLCYSFNAFCQGKVTRPTQQQSQTSKYRKSTHKVKFSEPDGYINGHGYVDLGLPSGTKWGTCNLGSLEPNDCGNYYAWGEIAVKDSYNEQNSFTFGINYTNLEEKNIISAEGLLTPRNDAARLLWGNPWRMPTKYNYDELIENCKWEAVILNTQRGWRVQGKNGKSIFFPDTGYRHDLCHTGEREDDPCYSIYGYYWTATVCKEDSECSYLYKLGFEKRILTFGRDGGAVIRAIISMGE